MRKFKQFLDPKRRLPGGHDVKGIFGHEIGPVRRQGAQMAGAVMKPSSVLTPVLATLDQIKLLAEQWMVRVRYPQRSALNVSMRRS